MFWLMSLQFVAGGALCLYAENVSVWIAELRETHGRDEPGTSAYRRVEGLWLVRLAGLWLALWSLLPLIFGR